jgi:hypothetical protein
MPLVRGRPLITPSGVKRVLRPSCQPKPPPVHLAPQHIEPAFPSTSNHQVADRSVLRVTHAHHQHVFEEALEVNMNYHKICHSGVPKANYPVPQICDKAGWKTLRVSSHTSCQLHRSTRKGQWCPLLTTTLHHMVPWQPSICKSPRMHDQQIAAILQYGWPPEEPCGLKN